MEEIRDFYLHTRQCIDEYNEIVYQVEHGHEELSDDQLEKLDHHCVYLAHALLKDAGPGAESRAELSKVCDIIKAVIKGDAYES